MNAFELSQFQLIYAGIQEIATELRLPFLTIAEILKRVDGQSFTVQSDSKILR